MFRRSPEADIGLQYVEGSNTGIAAMHFNNDISSAQVIDGYKRGWAIGIRRHILRPDNGFTFTTTGFEFSNLGDVLQPEWNFESHSIEVAEIHQYDGNMFEIVSRKRTNSMTLKFKPAYTIQAIKSTRTVWQVLHDLIQRKERKIAS